MPQLDSNHIPRIKRLDNRLANQIAAGEVVERPASVVKELMENAIDAGASRIEVDIERGGARLIRITDNGCGILKEDLSLALSRHATSKILNSKDLAAISSLGFRGEALASISSVSRLCLTSRTKDSDFAWQAIAEGRDMQVEIQPASATLGTRIEVKDLFYNTPARQKFLRAEKTEFGHVEDIFKRHALVNFETAFILKHNHKVVKRVPAGRDKNDYKKRIESICGKAFAENAIAFECDHDAINIKGWLGGINFHRSESDIQYVFVNGRPVKDKMLNHAIRQSYQGLLPPGRMPTYVIFLQVKPDKIDVNVHPTKHEVRFDEQRMIHDLLVKSVSEALGDGDGLEFDSAPGSTHRSAAVSESETLTTSDSNSESSSRSDYPKTSLFRTRAIGVGYSKVSYQPKSPCDGYNDRDTNQFLQNHLTPDQLGNNKIRLNNGFWIVLHLENAYIINEQRLLSEYLTALINGQQISTSKPLLFPESINIELSSLEEFETLKQLQGMGFVFEPNTEHSILLQQVPRWLDAVDKQIIFNYFSRWVSSFSSAATSIAIEAVYVSLKPLPEEMISDLLAGENFSFTQSPSVKQIDADAAQSLFVS